MCSLGIFYLLNFSGNLFAFLQTPLLVCYGLIVVVQQDGVASSNDDSFLYGSYLWYNVFYINCLIEYDSIFQNALKRYNGSVKVNIAIIFIKFNFKVYKCRIHCSKRALILERRQWEKNAVRKKCSFKGGLSGRMT